MFFKKRVVGVTGDIMGAAFETSETVALIMARALFA
jgi:cobalamin synthase